MGRRGVQQLTPAEWKEALEQQIREKEQQRINREEEPQRRSHSAPQHDEGAGELNPNIPGLARASTTSTCQENHLAGRRRRFQQQSREEYLQSLHEQIEEKKRLAQEVQEKEQSPRRRMSSEIKDDTEVGRESDGGDKCQTRMHIALQDAKPTGSSNQDEDEPCQRPLLKADVATDPVAISKIVDFCEELKKQNEDVKRQLLEQHTVLANLHSSLAGEVDRNDPARRRRSASKSRQSSERKAEMRSQEGKPTVVLPVAPRPRPERGETKIPFPGKTFPSVLQSAGADIAKRFAPEAATQPVSPLQKAKEQTTISTRVDTISIDCEKKTPPLELLIKSLDQEHTSINKIEASALDSRDCIERKASITEVQRDKAKDEDKDNCSAKDTLVMNICDLGGSRACIVIQPESVDDELPMDAESKLVHNWESYSTGDELLECTSIAILDGPSRLVSVSKPLSELFE
ncbi:Hypothetical protein PHPALM_4311 [Phytophthora palmivora]|uniref:Uncharacterized protein n=1 Tax=Phytophthora palmivora TaxID=4796 RepID=A0A2P4YK46_9STRA|nr:Hypothetical protein PHPALM_4311 [Phytophthora palmivora]